MIKTDSCDSLLYSIVRYWALVALDLASYSFPFPLENQVASLITWTAGFFHPVALMTKKCGHVLLELLRTHFVHLRLTNPAFRTPSSAPAVDPICHEKSAKCDWYRDQKTRLNWMLLSKI